MLRIKFFTITVNRQSFMTLVKTECSETLPEQTMPVVI